MDIVHHRLYNILYQCWLKYKLFFQVAEKKDASNIERLYCLLGLGAKEIRGETAHADNLLRYIGLFTQFPRSAVGLCTLLRDALSDVPIALTPCIQRMARIPASQRLMLGGASSRLGLDSYLGEEIEDRMGKFRISVGPLNQADFLRFTPGKFWPCHACGADRSIFNRSSGIRGRIDIGRQSGPDHLSWRSGPVGARG